MTEPQFYVATDEFGVERLSGEPNKWTLPKDGAPSIAVARPDGALIVLRTASALLDTVDEVIWIAEPVAEPVDVTEDGTAAVRSARIVRRTPWDPTVAANFALDCAEHGIGEGIQVELPNGQRIEDVIVDARAFLDSATGPTAHLGLLARLATIRRLKRENRLVTDLAYGLSVEDLDRDFDLTLDPAWTSAASVADSLFAALLEALRHLAFPRYVRARENLAVEQGSHDDESVSPTLLSTPWGSIALGGEHDSPYLPAAVAAREAALRAREAARDRSGADAEIAERAWQAERLSAVLG